MNATTTMKWCGWLAMGAMAMASQQTIAAAPMVTNVTAVERGGRQPVDIYYDLFDADGDLCGISVAVSTNSGAYYGLAPAHVSGDVGFDVATGEQKHVVWDVMPDLLSNFFCANMRVRVTANDTLYMVVDVSGGPDAATYPVTYQDTAPPYDDEHKTTKIVLRRCAAGSFVMGSPTNELGRDYYGETEHAVTLSSNFCIGVFEITQAQYTNVMGGGNPSMYQGDTRPVEGVSWNMVRGGTWPGGTPRDESFMGRLRRKTGLTFDLPTEAQWEYACRAGTTGAWNNGTTIADVIIDGNLNSLGCYCCDGGMISNHMAAGSFQASNGGLYDMHGNVWELCLDWIGYYAGTPETDPAGQDMGSFRVARGGTWDSYAASCRSAGRFCFPPDIRSERLGFRLALPGDTGPHRPFAGITNAPVTVPNGATNYAMAGTNNAWVVGTMWVSNVTAGGVALSFAAPAMGGWKAPAISLAEGPNIVRVYASNAVNVVAHYDAVVTRDGIYLVVDVSGGPDAMDYPVSLVSNTPPMDDAYRTTKILLRRIVAGSFVMGSPTNELGRDYYGETEHAVTLSSNFCIGVFQVTQAQYTNVMGGGNPSMYQGGTRPVEGVSWNMVRGGTWPGGTPGSESFMGTLQRKTGLVFDLPTEAQWEYACRAGTTGAWNNGFTITNMYVDDDMNSLGCYFFDGGLISNHVAVGSFQANYWGLYDMHGNVWECCLDWIGYYAGTPETDPAGQDMGSFRVARGGTWDSYAASCRSACRSCFPPDVRSERLGFRLALAGDVGAYRPFVGVTNAPVTVPNDRGSFVVAGTNNAWVVGNMWVSNATVGGAAQSFAAPAMGGWTAPAVSLAEGVNIVRVYASNVFNAVRYGTALVTRDGEYLVVDVSGGPAAATYPTACLTNTPVLDGEYKTTKILLRKIAAGSFVMGSPTNELGRDNYGETEHVVTLSSNFYIGVFQITQAQYTNVMDGGDPSMYQGGTRPVEGVSWNMVRGGTWPGGVPSNETFVGVLRAKTGLAFDLPTEAQWEYACRAGTKGAWNNGATITNMYVDDDMNSLGRYFFNGGLISNHVAVGSFQANYWGLYDMHGNVWECCLDWIGYYAGTPETDPAGQDMGSFRVARGGTWDSYAASCRSACRYGSPPDVRAERLGFRLAASAGQ